MEMYNVPWPELNRSPAAQVVAKLAVDSGLFLTHFEHRHHLPLPSARDAHSSATPRRLRLSRPTAVPLARAAA